MNPEREPFYDLGRFLSVAAYLTIGAVYFAALSALWGRRNSDELLALTALFAAFVFLQARMTPSEAPASKKRAFFGVGGLLAAAIAWLVPYGFTQVLYAILVAQAFSVFTVREALAWTLGYAGLIAIPLLFISSLTNAILTTFIYLGAFTFFAAMMLSYRREQAARASSERLFHELEAAHAQLRDYAARVEELAVAEERSRLAREIHDSLGHHLTLLSVELQAAAKLMALDPAKAAAEIEKAREVVAQALQDVRQSVGALRAPSAAELRPAEAIGRLLEEFRDATGIVVNYRVDSMSAALSPAQAMTLYRAAQEGLTNVQKHAHASRVDVTLEAADSCVRLCVADNGVGDSSSGQVPGFGLMGLRERIELLGGTLTHGRQDGAGFALCVELPVSKSDDRGYDDG